MMSDIGSMQSMSNLDCFLHRTTPVVPSKFLQQNEIGNLNRLWNSCCDKEAVEYFSLSDLWNSYNEWSAYGVGVPIHLNDEDTLVQYYVPYLSAIQILTSYTFREEIECGDSETRDSLSDSYSDDSECDKLWSSSEEGESIWNLDERLGHLNFQYFEKSTPYERVPLMDKINELAERYSGLMSLKSVDLSPASWMAVSWYPIYHIPVRRTIKDLSTCFLTYHTLSSSFQDMDRDDEKEGTHEKKKKGEAISLAPFGLATYKMQRNNLWASGKCGRDQEKVVSLCSVADSWLKQLNVHHHDFNYFMGIRHG
ncbi:uncharacterized protein LOC127101281 [Lathyrus oleraceus]|uniref:Uncharacterized protein n=1 Tax=Pisum sativum TaxID=3888 RepID=A0A9D4ZYT7_PEA|nr:uncharacterized protein LOC127101281 [Pisum sativum]KAI5389496.1 hypothetical protein KIW84_074961 [Pisum sativum]